MGILNGNQPVVIYTEDGGKNYLACNVNDSKDSRELLPGSIGRYMNSPNMTVTPNPWADEGSFDGKNSMIEAIMIILNEGKPDLVQKQYGFINLEIAQAETLLGKPLEDILPAAGEQKRPKDEAANPQSETIIKLVPRLVEQTDLKKSDHNEHGAM
ncbi:MAG: hypothetical protein WDZ73_00715 [Candidatus Paceibacterota bacterium]